MGALLTTQNWARKVCEDENSVLVWLTNGKLTGWRLTAQNGIFDTLEPHAFRKFCPCLCLCLRMDSGCNESSDMSANRDILSKSVYTIHTLFSGFLVSLYL